MKAGFSPKLALLGMKKNARLYVPYLLSCAFMAAVLYVIAFLAATPALYVINGKIDGAGTTTIQLVMSLGSGVISIFAALFLFYTNNGKVNGSGTSAVAMTMSLGSFVVSVFIALFLFYTNSFLLRRRKKEFGLYSVLGMDRGALGTILFWETLMAAAFTLVAGLGFGVLLSYLSQAVLLRLLGLPAVAFSESIGALKQCTLTFVVILTSLTS